MEESWCTSFLVGVPRSKMPGSPSSRMTTQLPLMRGSSELHRGGDEVGEGDAGNEPAALVHLQQRFFTLLPFGDADAATHHAGIDADVGNGLGEGEGAAPGLAIFTGLRRGSESLVVRNLFARAAFVNGGESEKAGEAGSGCSAVNPGEFECGQGQREILGPDNESTFFRLHEGGGNAGAIEGLEHLVLRGGPFVGVAFSAATMRATVPRATVRADWTSIWMSKRSAKRH